MPTILKMELTQKDTEIGQAKYPVYVWIYGGRFLWGAGSDYHFDGTSLAKRGIVVVTLNYRLGIFGWLAHPSLSAESGHDASGNYGLLDQIACLEWIQQNIAAFGGDRGRVTISGQSAGSACVGLHLYGPLSRGLFHRAIFQSGGKHPRDPLISCLAPSYRTKQQAENEGERVLQEKGVDDIDSLRSLSVEKLLEGNDRNDDTHWGPPPFYRACLDGWAFPRTYEETLLGGLANDVPVLNGQNKDEGGNYTHPEFNDEDLDEVVKVKYDTLAPRWHELYPKTDAMSHAGDRWNESISELSRLSPLLLHKVWRLKHRSQHWAYHFTHAPPLETYGKPLPPVPPKTPGYTFFKGRRGPVYHSAEIPYTFDSLWRTDFSGGDEWTQLDREVARTVSTYWENFIKSGNPNAATSSDMVYWPSCSEDGEHVMDLGDKCEIIPTTKSAERKEFLVGWIEGQSKAW